jgi:hypothetical protein
MRNTILALAAAIGAAALGGSAMAQQVLNPGAASEGYAAAAAPVACPAGTHWVQTQYYTRHEGLRPAGCYRD